MSLARHIFRRLAADVQLAPAPRVSRLAVGRYELLSLVSLGATSAVWRAWDPLLERLAAVRIWRQPLAKNERISARAAASFKALANHESPSCAQVFDLGRAKVPPAVFGVPGVPGGPSGPDGPNGPSNDTSQHAFCASEWIAGESLAERIEQGPLEPRQAAAQISALARGLAPAHRAGILHLDIKPSNILVTTSGPKLIDFAALYQPVDPEGQTARTPGTLGFLAPELAHGREDELGPRCDVYALGATLAALAAGTPLPGDDDLAAIDPALSAIFERAMAADPESRFASAVGLAAALDTYLAPDATGATGATGTKSPTQTDIRATRRRRLQALAATAALVAFAAFTLQIGKRLANNGSPSAAPTTADYKATLAEFARRSEPLVEWTLADKLELLQAQAGALLSRFSFNPADLDLFAAFTERGALAQAIEDLVRTHGQQLERQPLPAEITVFRRLNALAEGRTLKPADLEALYPASHFAQQQTALEREYGARHILPAN